MEIKITKTENSKLKYIDFDNIPFGKYTSDHMFVMEFTDGFIVPWHSHDNEQVTEVYEGDLRFWFDNDEQDPVDLFPGDSIIIPRNRPHKALMIGKVVEMDTFSPPRKDWINSSDFYLRK